MLTPGDQLPPPPPKKKISSVDELLPPPPKKKVSSGDGDGGSPTVLGSSMQDVAGVTPSLLAGQQFTTSRNPYAGVFDISTKLGLGADQTKGIYKSVSGGDAQPLVDIVKKLDEDLKFRKESYRKDNSNEDNVNELSGFRIYPDSDEEKSRFSGEEELVNGIRKQAANLIDASMADKLINAKGADAFYQAKNIGDERRRLRSEIGEEVGYKDEVGDIDAVQQLKNKFAYGIDIPTKEKQTQQVHDYLNERGIYEAAMKTLSEDITAMEEVPVIKQFNEVASSVNQLQAMGKEVPDELRQQYNSFLSDSTVNEYIRKIDRGQNFSQRVNQLPNSYPAVKVEQNRQALADAWANKVMTEDEIAGINPSQQTLRQFRKVFVGDNPTSDEDIKYLSDQTGIPVDQVKMFVNEPASSIGIPSRLGRAFRSATGVVNSSIEGANRLAYDSNEANVINKQLDKINYRPTQKLANRDWGVDKVLDTMADGLGQFAGYVTGAELLGAPVSALSKAVGAAGEAAQIGRTAATSVPNIIRGVEKAKSIGSTFATGYLSSFEDAYRYAATQTDDESKRETYAKSVAAANGISELILRDVDVAGKVLKGRNADDILNRFVNTKTPFTTGDIFKARLGEFAKVIGYESAEELLPYAVEVFQKDNVLGNKMSTSEIYNGALQTIVQTAISTVPMGAFSSLSVPTQSIMEGALLEAAKTPDVFNNKFREMYEKGTISEEAMNKNIKTVNTVADIYKKLPPTINGEPLSEEQQAKLVNLALGKRQLKNQKENVDESFHGPIDNEEKAIDQKISEVIQPQQPISNDTQEAVQNIPATPQENVQEVPSEEKIKVGDEVQWTSQGADQFDVPRKVTSISDDGQFAFVEGSNTGIPVEQLSKQQSTPISQEGEQKSLFQRASESATEGIKLLIGETETPEGLKALNEQALDTPNGLLSGLNNNRELVIDIISQNSEEDINKSIDRWTNDIADDKVTPEEGDAHISLLEEGLAKKQPATQQQAADVAPSGPAVIQPSTTKSSQRTTEGGVTIISPERTPADISVTQPTNQQPQSTETRRGVTVTQPEQREKAPEPPKETRASNRIRSVAEQIRKKGLSSVYPNWAKADLPEGTKELGFGGKHLDDAVAKALDLVADAIDAGVELSQAIKNGFENLKEYYKNNTKSFDEKKLEEDFTNFADNVFSRTQEPKAIVTPVGYQADENGDPIAPKGNFFKDKTLSVSAETAEYLSKPTIEAATGKQITQPFDYNKADLELMEADGKRWIELARQVFNASPVQYAQKLVGDLAKFNGSAAVKAVAAGNLLNAIDTDLRYKWVLSQGERDILKAQREKLEKLIAKNAREGSLTLNAQRLLHKLYNGNFKYTDTLSQMVTKDVQDAADKVVDSVRDPGTEVSDAARKQHRKQKDKKPPAPAKPKKQSQKKQNKGKFESADKNLDKDAIAKLKDEIRDLVKKIKC